MGTNDETPKDGPTPNDETPNDESTQDGTAEKDWQAEARKWQNQARANAVKAKQAAELETKLRDYEDANKTELQKLTERASDAEARAVKAERNAMRHDVALRKGLPPKLAARLQGDDLDAMEADADELLAEIGPRTPGDPGTQSRRDPDQGRGVGGPAGKGGSGDINDWMRRAANVHAS